MFELFFKRDELVKQHILSKSEYENLVLYNYTEKATYSKHWTKDVIESRGTIYDKNTGLVVAQAFPKFFNLEEHETTRVATLPWDKPFQVFDKADGSLGILYRHNEELKVSTRGSFYSDQANKATEMLAKYDVSKIPDHYTLLFEIIYPANHIVVNYKDKEALILLAAFDIDIVNKTGNIIDAELSRAKLEELSKETGIELIGVNNYTLDDMLTLKDKIKWNESEGWVVRFHDGTRVKIKGTEYLEMAKILSNMSPLSVWEAMMTGNIHKYLESIPEEIRDQAEEIHNRLNNQWIELVVLATDMAKKLITAPLDMKDKAVVKAVAIEIEKTPDWMHTYLFMAMRGKHDDSCLLEFIRPKGNIYIDLKEVMK